MVMLLISRVAIVYMILPVALSTMSNLLVGWFFLVDSVLILLSSRPPELKKINCSLSEPLLLLLATSYLAIGW